MYVTYVQLSSTFPIILMEMFFIFLLNVLDTPVQIKHVKQNKKIKICLFEKSCLPVFVCSVNFPLWFCYSFLFSRDRLLQKSSNTCLKKKNLPVWNKVFLQVCCCLCVCVLWNFVSGSVVLSYFQETDCFRNPAVQNVVSGSVILSCYFLSCFAILVIFKRETVSGILQNTDLVFWCVWCVCVHLKNVFVFLSLQKNIKPRV